MKIITGPTLLSAFRLVAGPLIIFLFLSKVQLSDLEILWPVLYIIACITDYYDGYIARAIPSQKSVFGAFIDQFADKVLVGSMIAAIVVWKTPGAIEFAALALIVVREIRVSALRGFTSKKVNDLPSSCAAKWKTTFQMIACGLLLGRDGFYADMFDRISPHLLSFDTLGAATLFFGVGLTLWSWFEYEQHQLSPT